MSKKPYKIILHNTVPKELKRLPKKVREKCKSFIEGLASEPVPPKASRIHGRLGCYHIRVGDYRIVYEVHVTEIVIYVIGVGHRREIYRRLLPRRFN